MNGWIIAWMDEYMDEKNGMDVWKYEWMKEIREKCQNYYYGTGHKLYVT